jgi:hypothetical protein
MLPRRPPAAKMAIEMSAQNLTPPPATFEFLVLSLRFQAEAQLGLIPWDEEPAQVNLPAARHTIDLLAMLVDKTKGNLTVEEQRLIENSLTELRFRYIGASQAGPDQTGATDAGKTPPEHNG